MPDFTPKLKDPSLLYPATLAVTADETKQNVWIEGKQSMELIKADS